MSAYYYKAAGLSDAGSVKEINQDCFLCKMGSYNGEQFVLTLVADGMGGVEEGEMASRSIRTAFSNWYDEKLPQVFEAECIEEALLCDWEELIRTTHLQLNEYGRQKGMEKGRCPGTTLSAMLLYGGTHYVVSIGDSRVYKQSGLGATLRQLTKDHSWAQQARDEGKDDAYIQFDARRNMITRCIGCGLEDSAKADYYTGAYLPDDYYMLCTDGLRHCITAQEISDTLLMDDLNTKEKCSFMIELAKSRGESDNITGVIVKIMRGE